MRLMLVLLIPVLLFLAGCNKGVSSNEESTNNSKINITEDSNRILFWGEGCSHCEVVEEYLKENDSGNSLGLKKIEVFSNKDLQELYLEKAKICGENVKSISVPMLYFEGKCFSGDTPIIDFLKEK